VTGYYTPREEEFTGPSTQIDVPGHGFVKFPLDFVRHVQVEGWGLTRYGWYLGWEQGWTKDDAPRDSRGERLRNGSLAVDPSVIPFGTRVQIPNLPPPWDEQSFIAADTGGAIEGKHVDVYCGAGPAALREAIRITANNRRVCSS